jgi:hypothetical protein
MHVEGSSSHDARFGVLPLFFFCAESIPGVVDSKVCDRERCCRDPNSDDRYKRESNRERCTAGASTQPDHIAENAQKQTDGQQSRHCARSTVCGVTIRLGAESRATPQIFG